MTTRCPASEDQEPAEPGSPGSGRTAFVAVMAATDLRKWDDLASRRRLDTVGGLPC
jgi:hypothetical protein